MPKKTGTSKQRRPVVRKKVSPVQKAVVRDLPRNSDDLEGFIREASEVKALTATPGWAILERDLLRYKEEIFNKLAYLSPLRPEFEESRALFIATDKLLSIVNDYEYNRDKAIELLNKLQNPELAVVMDIDTE